MVPCAPACRAMMATAAIAAVRAVAAAKAAMTTVPLLAFASAAGGVQFFGFHWQGRPRRFLRGRNAYRVRHRRTRTADMRERFRHSLTTS